MQIELGESEIPEHLKEYFEPVEQEAVSQKNLMGIPWRVAFALQADNWILRSDIIWAKGVSFCPTYSGSCMPESVRDRPTKGHEYVLLLTKKPRYFYDGDAVRETQSLSGWQKERDGGKIQDYKRYHTGESSTLDTIKSNPAGRNLRTVWTINPGSYAGAHFATFPPALVEPMIKAGTSAKGCCPECGASWVRVVERKQGENQEWAQDANPSDKETALIKSGGRCGHGKLNRGSKADYYANAARNITTGWTPTCSCDAKESTCAMCGFVLELPYLTKESSTNDSVSELQKDVRAGQASTKVLQPGMLLSGYQDSSKQGMPPMQKDLSPQIKQTEVLQPGLLRPLDGQTQEKLEGTIQDSQGLHSIVPPRPSSLDKSGLHNGASPDYGASAGAVSAEIGSSASQERGQGRQSSRELGCDGQEKTRRQQGPEVHSDLSTLSEGIPDPGECPRCGSENWQIAPSIAPCVVLDPFLGSGTTAEVADFLGRHSVGIELSKKYCDEHIIPRLTEPLFEWAVQEQQEPEPEIEQMGLL